MKNKSIFNKTIDISIEDGKEYLLKCQTEKNLTESYDAIINGDTFSILDKLKGKFDCIIVDPPYNLTKNYHGNTFSKKKTESYAQYTKTWLEKVKRLLSDNGSIYVCCDWKSSLIISQYLSDYFIIQNRITWQREKGRGSKKNFKNSLEDIWFCTNSKDYKFNVDKIMHRKKVIAPYKKDGEPKDWIDGDVKYRDTHPSNFWDDISVPFWSMAENTEHPTQKPEKLIAKLILASTDIGDKILDPFGGSGTTAVVCKKLGRHCVSIEQNPQYCIWTQIRLDKAEKDNSIQGYYEGVFYPRNFKTFK